MKIFKWASSWALLATLLGASGSSFAQKAATKAAAPRAVSSVAPDFLGANGLPRVGMRVEFSAGDQTLRGTEEAGKDENGRSVDQFGNPVAPMPLENQAGVGFSTVDIVQSSPSLVVADLTRYLRTGENLSQVRHAGFDSLQGDATRLLDYWVSPAILAKTPSGTRGDVTVSRVRLSVPGHSLNTLSINTTNADGYIHISYDLGSGLLLASSSNRRANPGARGVAPERDARKTTFINLVGVRRLGFSWAGAAPPADLTPGRQISYQGGRQLSIPDGLPLPAIPLNSVITISKRAGLCVFAQVLMSEATPTGTPQQSTTSRAYASGSMDALWVPPPVIAALHAGQVVDEDPVTGFRVTFLGVKEGVAAFQEQNSVERTLRLYSAKSGLLVAIRGDSTTGVGTTTTSLQLAGQG